MYKVNLFRNNRKTMTNEKKPENESGSRPKKRRPNNRNRNRNRNRNKKNPNSEKNGLQAKENTPAKPDQKNPNRNPNRKKSKKKYLNSNRNRRPNSRSNGPKKKFPNRNNKPRKEFIDKPEPLKAGNIFNAYFVVLKKYLRSRNKFFNAFREKVDRRSRGAQNDYQRNLNALRKFQRGLKNWQKEELNNHLNALPLDSEYSTNNPDAETVSERPEKVSFFSFHEKPSQVQRDSYKQDTDESTGSMEDYQSYKESSQV